jgi:hypothetical protein
MLRPPASVGGKCANTTFRKKTSKRATWYIRPGSTTKTLLVPACLISTFTIPQFPVRVLEHASGIHLGVVLIFPSVFDSSFLS